MAVSRASIIGLLCLANFMAVLVAPADSLYANSVLFTDQSSFSQHTAATTTLTFDGMTNVGNYLNLHSSWASHGIAFYDPSDIYAVNDRWEPNSYANGFQFLAGNGNSNLTITLPAGVTSVGMEPRAYHGWATVYFSNSTHLDVDAPPDSFLGIASDDPQVKITSMIFWHNGIPTSGYNVPYLDSFSIGTYVAGPSGAIPEPVTLLTACLGLGGLASYLRKRFHFPRPV